MHGEIGNHLYIPISELRIGQHVDVCLTEEENANSTALLQRIHLAPTEQRTEGDAANG